MTDEILTQFCGPALLILALCVARMIGLFDCREVEDQDEPEPNDCIYISARECEND